MGRVAAIAVGLVAIAAPARAQEPGGVVPPSLVSLPEVELPPGVAMPEGGAVALELEIDASGSARVLRCDAGPAVCELVSGAIARGDFEPATRDGTAVPSRIGMRFAVRRAPPEPDPEKAAGTKSEGSTAAEPEGEAVAVDPVGFRATARVESPPRSRLDLDDMFEVSEGFGGAIREIEMQPGVTPAFSGLPYFYVRGSPPSGSRFEYDGIDVPALYHLALGPPIVHPGLAGRLRMYPAVPPARYGGLIGGVVAIDAPELRRDGVHGEIETRLLDSSAMVSAPVGEGHLMAAGRYGYPFLLLSIFSPDVALEYGDYQVRFEYPISSRDRVEVVALGSYDYFSAVHDLQETIRDSEPRDSLEMQFHRLEARLVRALPGLEVGAALRAGWEQADLDGDVELGALTMGSRLWLETRGEDARLRVGGEVMGAAGDLELSDEGVAWGEGPQVPAPLRVAESVAARSRAALYAELGLAPHQDVSLDFGVRSEIWTSGGDADLSVEPRVRGVLHVSDELDLVVAGGMVRQPAVFFAPLPGLSHVAIDDGLQTAYQGELGARLGLPLELSVEAHLFAHRYTNLLFPDLYLEAREVCTPETCIELAFDKRIDGVSYGGEVFLESGAENALAGFLSYTLAWSEVDPMPPLHYTPSYDVRHVLNLAGRWDMGAGWSAALRTHFRTGRPFGVWFVSSRPLTLQRYEQRLPPFVRIDVRVSYSWRTSWGRFQLAFEWLNLTWSEEPVAIMCPPTDVVPPREQCPVDYTPAIVVPNIGISASF